MLVSKRSRKALPQRMKAQNQVPASSTRTRRCHHCGHVTSLPLFYSIQTCKALPPCMIAPIPTWSAPRRAGLCCRALLGSRKPGVWPYTDAGVPALPPCCRARGAVCDTTLFARLSLGDTGCCCCCCWCACPCGDAGCTAVEIRLLLGLWKRPRDGLEWPGAAGLGSAE
jgi:hypothetical protein